MKRQPPIAAIRVGALIDCTLQIVDVLLEQSSIPSSEFDDRVTFALRYDVNVRSFVPPSNSRLAFCCPSSGTAALCTICVAMVPSFLTSLRGLLVLMNSGIEGSISIRPAEPS